ncbi:hypothetical protein PF003_g40304 [Phytophthora fragariae]|nr:hypothetical protein PF003_g40304 [Phytophthora fragariae]
MSPQVPAWANLIRLEIDSANLLRQHGLVEQGYKSLCIAMVWLAWPKESIEEISSEGEIDGYEFEEKACAPSRAMAATHREIMPRPRHAQVW